jgi:hypothetical protein
MTNWELNYLLPLKSNSVTYWLELDIKDCSDAFKAYLRELDLSIEGNTAYILKSNYDLLEDYFEEFKIVRSYPAWTWEEVRVYLLSKGFKVNIDNNKVFLNDSPFLIERSEDYFTYEDIRYNLYSQCLLYEINSREFN